MVFHWNAEEARERAARLSAAGFDAQFHAGQGGGAALRPFRENPPDAFVIDLSRLPSQGRAVGTFLRQQKGTRHVPIVFVDGDPEKVELTRRLLPDAVYTEWRKIRPALRKAIANPSKTPVVPETMQGYSGTPLPKKLGIKAGSVVALLGAPADFERKLEPLPDNVRVQSKPNAAANLILLFAKSRADLDKKFPAAVRTMAQGGGLWIAWPKKASGVATDLTEPAVRQFGLAAGLVDYKICAIDETWSGLLFARRRLK